MSGTATNGGQLPRPPTPSCRDKILALMSREPLGVVFVSFHRAVYVGTAHCWFGEGDHVLELELGRRSGDSYDGGAIRVNATSRYFIFCSFLACLPEPSKLPKASSKGRWRRPLGDGSMVRSIRTLEGRPCRGQPH